jgi:hypothetical protein
MIFPRMLVQGNIFAGTWDKGGMQMKAMQVRLFILLVSVLASFAQDSAEPPDHGAYYKATDGLQKLQLLTATGTQASDSGVATTYRGAVLLFRASICPRAAFTGFMKRRANSRMRPDCRL